MIQCLEVSSLVFFGLHMSLTFPHYERARVHPQNKAVQEMILGGSNLALLYCKKKSFCIPFLAGSNLALL